MIWATVSSQSCFCWLYRASPSLASKNIINLISLLTIWWCPDTILIPLISVKSLPAMQETQFQSLGQEDPLEKEMATHSSILAWRIPWTEEPGGLYIVHRVTKNRNMIKTNVEAMVNPYKFFFLIFKKCYWRGLPFSRKWSGLVVRNPPCNAGTWVQSLVLEPCSGSSRPTCHMVMAKLVKRKSLMKAKIHALDCNRIFCALGNPEIMLPLSSDLLIQVLQTSRTFYSNYLDQKPQCTPHQTSST